MDSIIQGGVVVVIAFIAAYGVIGFWWWNRHVTKGVLSEWIDSHTGQSEAREALVNVLGAAVLIIIGVVSYYMG